MGPPAQKIIHCIQNKRQTYIVLILVLTVKPLRLCAKRTILSFRYAQIKQTLKSNSSFKLVNHGVWVKSDCNAESHSFQANMQFMISLKIISKSKM